MLNPKHIMLAAKNEVSTRGWVEEGVPIGMAPVTVAHLHQYAYQFVKTPDGSENGGNSSVAEMRAALAPIVSIPQSRDEVMENMEVLLGRDMVAYVRYLMQVVPSVRVYAGQVEDEGNLVSLSYRRADGDEYHLATLARLYGSEDDSVTVLFSSLQFRDDESYLIASPEGGRPQQAARQLYAKALGIHGLAPEYFGPEPLPFPEPT